MIYITNNTGSKGLMSYTFTIENKLLYIHFNREKDLLG
jgi:hypothetical protein